MTETFQDEIVGRYFRDLSHALSRVEATSAANEKLSIGEAFGWASRTARRVSTAGNKVMFAGNGGSAGICSHMTVDYGKNGNIRSLALNDGAVLTCLGNDPGFEQVFAKQIEMLGRPGDLLVAISSSGRSPNILNAVATARRGGMEVLTLSGFAPDNPLRQQGDVNLYIASPLYGFVEISHLALCHAILDLTMGWSGTDSA